MGRLANKRRRRKFNGPRGRHSEYAKKKYRTAHTLIETHLRHVVSVSKPKPYKIKRVMNIVDGQPSMKIIVKRLNPVIGPNVRAIPRRNASGISIHKVDAFDPDSYRLLHLGNLQKHISALMRHAATCAIASANIGEVATILGERNVCGLAGELSVRCVCGQKFDMSTSPVVKIKPDVSYHDINLRAVWGTMVSGRGASSLAETFATMNMPTISQKKFSTIEDTIGNLWNDCLKDDMMAAAEEERKLAIENGDFHDGVPAITVICDGGWSKRSHKHSYNALGGVGVIFGARTGKILHLGVRNKHCYVCAIADARKTTVPNHTCFKNWTESSQAMEADIIVDGFLNAEKLYGLRYIRMIADGDSSVFARIQQTVPVWGSHVLKMECSNHVCKCLRSSLEKLVSDKPHYKGTGGLTKTIRVRLTTAVRCAIRMRSKEPCKKKAVRQLELDIRNAVHHIFGNHTNCSDFCKNISTSPSVSLADHSTVIESEDVDSILEDQERFWSEGSSEIDMENSRIGSTCTTTTNMDPDMLADISFLLDRVATKSNRLIGNFTSNLAESWMSIRMKFDGGKVFNRCHRGSWHARCYGGALRKNLGPSWSPLIWQRTTGVRPGQSFISVYRQRSLQLLSSLKSQEKDDVRTRKKKRKMTSSVQSATKKAKREYGPASLQVVEDVSPKELQAKCEHFLTNSIELTDEKCKQIELDTKMQSYSQTWKEERRRRLTASNFGDVFQRNPKKSTIPLLRRLLYSSFQGTQYTRFGLFAEQDTIKEYIQKKTECGETVTVSKMGLSIDTKNKFLAASCDGMVVLPDGSCGLIEIKNLLQRSKFLFSEAARKMKSFCCEEVNGLLKLKHNHKYYFQVQGQMNITKMPWCDFIMRRTQPYQLHIERIYRDSNLWTNQMLPKLCAFYTKCILPEIVLPRYNTSTGIRDPELPWFVSVATTHAKKPTSCTSSCSERPHKQTSTQENPQPGPSTASCAVASDKDSSVCGIATKNSQSDPCKESITNSTRTRRRRNTKFVGRRIQHEWVTDETTGQTKWYSGIVLDVLSGKDGQPSAVYEILYDGEDEPHEIDNIEEDLKTGSLKFLDL